MTAAASSSNSRTARWAVLAIWLSATVIGIFLSLVVVEAAFVDGEYLPTGNDSFYHARRMLDFAVGERGFYEYDTRIDAPDGIWVPWPWAYDFLMGGAAAMATRLSPSLNPMAFLAHVPVAWLAVNAGLFLAAARQAGLDLRMTALAMLAFALAPFLQMMHMVGRVDHHFAEFTFVLLTTLLGLRWFSSTERLGAAIGLGIALGFAPGFHNGLFVLQIPVLLCAGVLWLRGYELAHRGVVAVAAALVAATLLVVLPSGPFRQGLFEFGYLSGFHLYVAACSGAVLAFLAFRQFDRKSLSMLAAGGILMVIPIFGQLGRGTAFLARELPFLEQVLEAMDPFTLTGRFGAGWTAAHYSWLWLAAVPLLIYYLWRLWRDRDPAAVFFAATTVFGLAFMLTQFRFYYFGLFSLIVGSLVAAQHALANVRWHKGAVFAALLGVLLIAYQPPLRGKLFDVYALGASPLYERARPVFLDLGDRCDAEPGLVLANQHDGNYLLYHTECSVISNTFMLTEQDEGRIDRIDELMRLTPAALRESAPEIDYLVLRRADFLEVSDGRYRLDRNRPLAALLLDRRPPAGFELIRTVWIEQEGQQRVYAKAFAVRR